MLGCTMCAVVRAGSLWPLCSVVAQHSVEGRLPLSKVQAVMMDVRDCMCACMHAHMCVCVRVCACVCVCARVCVWTQGVLFS